MMVSLNRVSVRFAREYVSFLIFWECYAALYTPIWLAFLQMKNLGTDGMACSSGEAQAFFAEYIMAE